MAQVDPEDAPHNYITEAAQLSLSNILIVEQIVQYLPFRDLKVLCLVSKCWQNATLKPLKKSAQVTLFQENETSKFITYLQSADDDRVWKLYTNFKLHSIDFTNPAHMHPFWTRLGAQIRMLTLACCDFPNKDTLRQILFEKCPHLELLRLEQVVVIPEYSNTEERQAVTSPEPIRSKNINLRHLIVDPLFKEDSGISWEELFNHFSSIQTFELIPDGANTEGDEELYQAICEIRRLDSAKLMLKEISVIQSDNVYRPPTPPALKHLLLNSGLHFEKISISLNRVRNKMLLRQMLTQQSESLANLKLDGKRCKNFLQPTNCFPPNGLENLTKLTLQSGVFTSLGFLQFTPNLKKLSLIGDHATLFSGTSRSEVEMWQHERCKDLEVSDVLSVEDLGKLVKILPNVDRLKMSLDYDTLEFVCAKWKKLVSLMVYNCVISDDGDIAFDSEIEMVGSGDFAGLRIKEGTHLVSSITSLEHLRRLSLICMEGPEYDRARLWDPGNEFKNSATRFGMERNPALYSLRDGQYDFIKPSLRNHCLLRFLFEYNFP